MDKPCPTTWYRVSWIPDPAFSPFQAVAGPDVAAGDSFLNLTTNVYAKCTASVPVECENEHLLASLPEIDDPSDGSVDFGVCSPTALLQRLIEFIQVPSGTRQD